MAGLNHLSFEVPDADAVFKDHEYLAGLEKYEHMWGIGRHILGSQIFDYWCDPWGRVHGALGRYRPAPRRRRRQPDPGRDRLRQPVGPGRSGKIPHPLDALTAAS